MKKLWNLIKPIVYSYTVQYILIIVGVIIFTIVCGRFDLLNDVDKIYEISVIGIVVTSVPISIYLYKKYKDKESMIKLNIWLMVPFGMSISLFYNMLTISFMAEANIDMNPVLLIIYLVIVGPIFEEMVFRYAGLRNAKNEYSLRKAIVVVSVVFALLHSGIFNMIYAFLIGMVLSYVYVKYKNIMYPIVLHISANLMSVCISEFNVIALIISFIVLLLIWIYLKKTTHNVA